MARWLWHDIGWLVGVYNDLVMRTWFHEWALQVLDHFNSFCSYFGLCSWEAIFWKFAIILDSFVKCFYIFTIMMAMTFLNCATPCLIIILPIVIFSALCLFEKPRVEFFAFSPWFMHCQQGGEFCIWDVYLGIFRVFSCIPGLNLSMCNFGFWRRSNRDGTRSDRVARFLPAVVTRPV